MRAIVVCPSLGGGGAERATLGIAGGLDACGVETTLVIEKDEPPLFTAPRVHRIVHLHSSSTRNSILPLRRILRQTQPDFVYSALPHLNLISLAAQRLARAPTKLVPSLHNNIEAEMRFGLPNAGLLARALPLVLRCAAGVVVVSRGVGDQVAHYGVASHKIWMLPNPVDESSFISPRADRVDNSWDGPFPRLLSMGRLVEQKNYALLLRSFALVKQSHPAAQLTILGDGPERASLRDLAGELGLSDAVKMPGAVTDVLTHLRRADVYVQSSRFEGFGLAILEAQAAAVPVVSTDCDFGPRDLIDHGTTGLLVPLDADALAHAIGRVLHDAGARERMIAEAYTRARRYSSRVIASELLDKVVSAG